MIEDGKQMRTKCVWKKWKWYMHQWRLSRDQPHSKSQASLNMVKPKAKNPIIDSQRPSMRSQEPANVIS